MKRYNKFLAILFCIFFSIKPSEEYCVEETIFKVSGKKEIIFIKKNNIKEFESMELSKIEKILNSGEERFCLLEKGKCVFLFDVFNLFEDKRLKREKEFYNLKLIDYDENLLDGFDKDLLNRDFDEDLMQKNKENLLKLSKLLLL